MKNFFHGDVPNHEGHNHGDHNPHIWLDPIRMMDMADLIKDKLIELYPDNKAIYIKTSTL